MSLANKKCFMAQMMKVMHCRSVLFVILSVFIYVSVWNKIGLIPLSLSEIDSFLSAAIASRRVCHKF